MPVLFVFLAIAYSLESRAECVLALTPLRAFNLGFLDLGFVPKPTKVGRMRNEQRSHGVHLRSIQRAKEA